MRTFQDLQKVTGSPKALVKFIRASIDEYKRSDLYLTAEVADEYYRHRNRTIIQYQKLLYTISGNTVPDNFSANFKIPSNHFKRFVNQQTQFLLGNGITWKEEETKAKLGDDFDFQVQKAAKNSIVQAVTYGFWNLNHLEVFTAKEFVPFYDETNGALMAGIRFWQIDDTKPLRATFYEIDGYTDYMWRAGQDAEVINPKRNYIQKVSVNNIEGETIYDGENYPSFPIIPCFANTEKQSEFVGLRAQIDSYDLIKSQFANDLDDASQIYWTIENAGGMDDIDLATFIQRMKTLHAAIIEDGGASAEAHTIDVPYAAREALLTRLESDMYKDFMAFNPADIVSGAVTATQIQAAYEPINVKADGFEYCIIEFLRGILKVAGIEGEDPTFTRSMLINQSELITNITQAALYLPQEYVTKKIMTILGDGDATDDAIEAMNVESYTKMRADAAAASGEGPDSQGE